jgi:hypothetical protein
MSTHTSRAQTVTEAVAQLVKEKCLTGGAIFLGKTADDCTTVLVENAAELDEKLREYRESGKYRFVAGACRQLYKGNDSIVAWGYRHGDQVFGRNMILLQRNQETWWAKSWVEPVPAEAA